MGLGFAKLTFPRSNWSHGIPGVDYEVLVRCFGLWVKIFIALPPTPYFSSLFGIVHCPLSHRDMVHPSPVHPNSVGGLISFPLTHKPHYLFLKIATIPTYYGISIAIPRYIAMQLPFFTFHYMTYVYIVILLCMIIYSWHDSCGKATCSSLFYMLH